MKSLFIAFFICLLILNSSCSPKVDPSLQAASVAIAANIAPAQMTRSGFSVIYPTGKPSQFVNYYFSPMGKSEWPPNPSEGKALPGLQTIPGDVQLVPFRPDITISSSQIVMRADDETGEIILDGYLPNMAEPQVSRRLPLTHVKPDPATKLLVEDNLSMGMSFEYSPSRNDENEIDEGEEENP